MLILMNLNFLKLSYIIIVFKLLCHRFLYNFSVYSSCDIKRVGSVGKNLNKSEKRLIKNYICYSPLIILGKENQHSDAFSRALN